ncbi:MAG TPA: PhzF family phenazine biosynthesis protein [Abditibacterium sp.]|jgi:PhzF family phenazine biosynthesis protein
MLKTSIFIADAFVGSLEGRQLRGNPAAVAVLEAPRDAAWMQNIAHEMNLSETAFVVPKSATQFDLRWFTPTCEVELCGHATLAAAHVLIEYGWLASDEIAHFYTLSGILTAQKRSQWIGLDFPSQKVEARDLPVELAVCLGLKAAQLPVQAFRAADDWLIEVAVPDFSRVDPDYAALKHFCRRDNSRGVIVTARGEKNIDFISRFFGPAVGVDEDPVTGSAHTKLAPFWGTRLQKREMLGFQASNRGGLVRVEWRDDRVILAGEVVTVLRGDLLI